MLFLMRRYYLLGVKVLIKIEANLIAAAGVKLVRLMTADLNPCPLRSVEPGVRIIYWSLQKDLRATSTSASTVGIRSASAKTGSRDNGGCGGDLRCHFHVNEGKNEQQAISYTDIQVQKMFEAREGIFAKSICVFSYPAVSGHLLVW